MNYVQYDNYNFFSCETYKYYATEIEIVKQFSSSALIVGMKLYRLSHSRYVIYYGYKDSLQNLELVTRLTVPVPQEGDPES